MRSSLWTFLTALPGGLPAISPAAGLMVAVSQQHVCLHFLAGSTWIAI